MTSVLRRSWLSTSSLALIVCSALLEAQTAGVPSNFGGLPRDAVLTYGFQYKSLPRVSGSYSAAYVLPGSLSYTAGSRLAFRVEAATLMSVEYPSKPRATGVSDSDVGASFVVATENLQTPKITVDYQLNLPTGDGTLKLGAGQRGHRLTASLSKLRNNWTYQGSLGNLLTRKQSSYLYSNILFTAMSASYSFAHKDSDRAGSSLKTEVDFIPPYSAVPQNYSASTPNKRYPTEIYTVSTFALPLKWQTKLSLVGRAGLTPYTPKCVVMVQLQHLFRHQD